MILLKKDVCWKRCIKNKIPDITNLATYASFIAKKNELKGKTPSTIT